jgi:hypothetical protein
LLHRAITAYVNDDDNDNNNNNNNNNNPVLGFYSKYIKIREKAKERPAFEK